MEEEITNDQITETTKQNKKCIFCDSNEDMCDWNEKTYCSSCWEDLCLHCEKKACTCICVLCGKCGNNVRRSEGKIFCFKCLRCSVCKVGDVKTLGWTHYAGDNFKCGNCSK